MRPLLPAIALASLLAGIAASANDSMSLNAFSHRVEPVLVQVNAQGKVTDASPAYPLSPKLGRLLRANLDEMIAKPATDKHGKPVASQFIMNVALQAEPLPSGDYSARFGYVSTAPVPAGSWYWVHIDGHRLALANRNDQQRTRLPMRRDSQHIYRPAYRGGPANPMPAIRSPSPQPAAMPAPRQIPR